MDCQEFMVKKSKQHLNALLMQGNHFLITKKISLKEIVKKKKTCLSHSRLTVLVFITFSRISKLIDKNKEIRPSSISNKEKENKDSSIK